MRDLDLERTLLIAGFIVKYLEGTITEEEQSLLYEWQQEKEANQQLFNQFIEKEKINAAIGKVQQIEEKKELKLLRIINRIKQPQPAIIRLLTTKKWKYIATASVLLFLSAGAFFYIINRETSSDKSGSSSITTPYAGKDIPPGGNKAVLKLADGATIVLDSAGNGTLARQGNMQVVKLDSGRLSYQSSPGSYRSDKGQPVLLAYNILTTPKGGQYQLLLPDGSKVWLNAASSLRFPTAFTDRERKVELTGEAYFEIAPQSLKGGGKIPFKVSITPPPTGGDGQQAEVEVLGTHFNVMAYDDESAIKATLLEGAVKVIKGSATTLLAPGQQAQWNKNGGIRLVKGADVEEALAWKNGLFIFRSADIKTVMRQIARWYDVEVAYEGQIPDLPLTGEVPRNITLANLLKALQLAEVRLRIEGRKIIVIP